MKTYAKPALSVAQQVAQLQRRGMAIADPQAAAHFLAHINYYRLRAYWLPCEVPAAGDGDHAFRTGTQFEAILDLYGFDRKLRLLVMDAIERIEVSLRTRWAYVLGMRHGSHAYMEPARFRNATQHAKCMAKLRDELARSNETFVGHYFQTYDMPELPPVWAVCEVLTFGQLSIWFQNLADGGDRAEIARMYALDEQVIKSFAHHLAYVRNVCAHHSRLWNRELTIGMKLPNNPATLAPLFNRQQPKRLYNTLVLLAYMLDIISPASRWREQLLALLGKHPKVELAAMGFPGDWRQSPIWERQR